MRHPKEASRLPATNMGVIWILSESPFGERTESIHFEIIVEGYSFATMTAVSAMIATPKII